MKKPSGTISATTLREKMRGTESEMQRLEKEINDLMVRHDELKIRHTAYAELLRELKPSENGAQATAPKATDVAMEFVRAHPDTRSTDIVDEMLRRTKTTAKDPRKNAHQTILNLKNRGWLERDGNGGWRVGKTNGHGGATP